MASLGCLALAMHWTAPLRAQDAPIDGLPPRVPLRADEHTVLLLRGDREAPYSNGVKDSPAIESHGKAFLVKGRFDEALAVRDWRSRLEVPHSDRIKPGEGGQLTVEFWLKGEYVNHWRHYGIVMRKPGLLRINFSRTRKGEIVIDGKLMGEKHASCSLRYAFPDDFDWTAWHHYAFVYGVDTGRGKPVGYLFVDGKRVDKETVHRKVGSSDKPLTLFNGESSRSHRWTRPFAGALDDIRISNTVRYVDSK
jgi:hypothetical protein